MTQPIKLIKSMNNTPKTGLWYSAGTSSVSDECEIPEKGIITFVSWEETLSDWKFITLKDGDVVSTGMMKINFGVEE
jgi:hypothetical protein